jgi:hypothetical protein
MFGPIRGVSQSLIVYLLPVDEDINLTAFALDLDDRFLLFNWDSRVIDGDGPVPVFHFATVFLLREPIMVIADRAGTAT